MRIHAWEYGDQWPDLCGGTPITHMYTRRPSYPDAVMTSSDRANRIGSMGTGQAPSPAGGMFADRAEDQELTDSTDPNLRSRRRSARLS